MRILSVVWFKVLPAKYGGQKGTAVFNKYLAQQVELTCLCSSNNEPDPDLPYHLMNQLPVSKLQFINPFTWLKTINTSRKQKINFIILEYPYHAISGILAKSLLGIKLIIHEHNIEFERFRKQNKWWWKLLKWYEGWACKNADLVIFKTKQDQQLAAELFGLSIEKSYVLPYSVEKPGTNSSSTLNLRANYNLGEQTKILLFSATLDYPPNAVAVESIYKHLAPLLVKSGIQFKIIITGRNHSPRYHYLNQLKHNAIIQTGEVNNIDDYYHLANVFINPVLHTNGIQTKNLDALAANLNVVTFKSAATGLDEWKEKIFIAENENWEDFAGNIKKALISSIPTPGAFYETYNWQSNISSLLQKLKQLSS